MVATSNIITTPSITDILIIVSSLSKGEAVRVVDTSVVEIGVAISIK